MLQGLRDFFDYSAGQARAREVTDDERSSWFAAAMEGDGKKVSLTTANQLRGWLYSCNPIRMRRLRKDFAWMQRMLIKQGRNPEDARWLL